MPFLLSSQPKGSRLVTQCWDRLKTCSSGAFQDGLVRFQKHYTIKQTKWKILHLKYRDIVSYSVSVVATSTNFTFREVSVGQILQHMSKSLVWQRLTEYRSFFLHWKYIRDYKKIRNTQSLKTSNVLDIDKNISGPSSVKCWNRQSTSGVEKNGRREVRVKEGRVITADCGD